MTHEYQKLNNCGPVALAIALSYYGVERTQFDIAPLVKGYNKDKNVSPEELLHPSLSPWAGGDSQGHFGSRLRR
jgi:hypothetical protein